MVYQIVLSMFVCTNYWVGLLRPARLHLINQPLLSFSLLQALPPTTEPIDHGKHSLFINILTAVLGAMFFVAAIIVVMIFKKLKREKIKKQLAIETARAVIVTHWTKKVTVEKPQANGAPTAPGELLVSSYLSYTSASESAK